MACILVVEDNRTIATVLQVALEDAGYRVLGARNGHEALHMLAQALPDLVLSDLRMPGMGGLELATRIHADPTMAAIRVVLMSAVTQPATNGVYQAFLHKPFDLDELLAVVGDLTADPCTA
jgi:CheY-like chemotaxis protein